MKKFVSIICALTLLMANVAQAETLTAKSAGFGGDVTVTLSIEDGKIVDCVIDAPKETPEIGGAAVKTLIQQILDSNGTKIDGVSSATYTSNAVRAAVEAIMKPDDGIVEKMKPGTYTASAMGQNDNVTVEVTVDETAIKSVKIVAQQETPGIGSPLYDENGKICENGGTCPVILLPQEIIARQSLAVDAVSGATVTSKAILGAVASAMEQAGADLKDWRSVSEKKVVIEGPHEADVVIVGAGGAGLSAAISAAQQGASVIVVEKTGMVGGDTLVCGATYNTWTPEEQAVLPDMGDGMKGVIEAAINEKPVNEEHAALIEEVRKEWEAFKSEGKHGVFDSAAWFTLQTWNGGDKVGDLKLIRQYADLAYNGYKWLLPLGMDFQKGMGQGAGALWQRSHFSVMNMGTGFISTYLDVLKKMDNVTIYLNMEGKELIKNENGRVIGLKCKDINGGEQIFSAKKGVVLATGGYGANSKLVQSYNTSGKWDDLSKAPTTNRHACSQGDGIIMAAGVGANTRDMDQIQLLYLGNLVDGGLTKYPARCVTATSQTIFVNTEGNRFVQEDGRRDQICKAVLAQPGAFYYIIEAADGSFYEDINDPKWRSADGFTREFLEENGFIYVANTLEELAAKIKVPAKNLIASVESYNACADAGVDKEFGRTNFACKLEHGPYVATPRQASIHHTMGGLIIDTDTHVLAKDGSIIEGLYAAGEVIGGLHGGNRLGGNAVTDVVVFGKLAGETAAKAE